MKYLEELKKRYNLTDELFSKITDAYKLMENTFLNKGKILVCGNGGSAADSEHIVGELMKSFIKERKLENDFINKSEQLGYEDLKNNLQGALPAISLVSQSGVITAFSNDNNPDYVYAQQVYGYGEENDTLIALTTSGNSKNILNAARCAKAKNMNVVSITNVSGGKIKEISDVNININETETFKVQELTLPIYHALCLELEDRFF